MPRGARKGERRGGRPAGSPNKVNAATRDYILSLCDPLEFLANVVKGEPFTPEGGAEMKPTEEHRMTAAMQLLKKIVPDVKPVALPAPSVDLPTPRDAGDIITFVARVAELLSRGEISHDDAAGFLSVADKARAAIDTDMLAKEVAELREILEGK